MKCKPSASIKSSCKGNTSCTISKKETRTSHNSISKKFDFTDLAEKGRLQYFYHSPQSLYPIRDILKHKTEPNIENDAENFDSKCLQKTNIIPFLKSNEKYLFLFTTCKNTELGKNYNKKKFIIGYIIKERFKNRYDENGNIFYAVQGKTKIFSFEDSFELKKDMKDIYNKKGENNARYFHRSLDEKRTKQILEHFNIHKPINKNILLNDIKKLKQLLK